MLQPLRFLVKKPGLKISQPSILEWLMILLTYDKFNKQCNQKLKIQEDTISLWPEKKVVKTSQQQYCLPKNLPMILIF